MPNTTITGSPAASTTSTSASFTFTSTPTGATFECALDGAAFAACVTPQAYTALALGNHTFSVRAINAAGTDATPATFAWTITAPSTGLVAAFGFEENTGTSTLDSSGTGNNGTVANATWSTAGRFGNALSFNGTNATVNVADAASLDLTNGMTVEAWVNPASLTLGRLIVIKEGATDISYALMASNGANMPAGWVRTAAGTAGATGTTALPLNTWTHVAATYDATTIRFYVNGTQVATQARTGAITTSTNVLRIGGSAFGSYFSGLIDEVRVYNRALTAAEITTDMNTQIRP